MDRTARLLAFVCLILFFAWAVPVAQARQVTVTTKQGAAFTGELISEDATQVVLEISGIRTPIAREDIESIQYKKTPQEEYDQRRGELSEDDFDGRYRLAYDMFEVGALQISLKELESLQTDFPEKTDTVDSLIEVVTLRIKLAAEEKQTKQDKPKRRPPAATHPAPGDDDEQDGIYLNKQQLNLIRLWELPTDLAKARPKIAIPRDVIDLLFEKYQSDEYLPKGKAKQRAFRAAPGWQQLEVIFEMRARDIYPLVIVRTDSQPLIDFRRIINPAYIVRYFRPYFGTGQIEGLTLLAIQPKRVEEAYTNFYILSMAKHEGQYLIDRDVPRESLMLQWGLPRERALFPAPEVPGWRPFYRNEDDPRFQAHIQWIESLYDRPDYGINYQPPPPDTESAGS